MKPLPLAQNLLSWYYIRDDDDPSMKGHELIRLIFVTFLPISVFTCWLSSILFFVKYVSTNFNVAVFSLLQIAIYFGLFYTMVVVAFSRHQIISIFSNLEKIYVWHKKDDSFKFLDDATNKGDKLFPSYVRLIMIGLFSVYVICTAAAVPLQISLTHTFNVDNLVHMQMLVLPWDNTTPWGYFWEIILSVVYVESYYTVNGPVLMLFVSICLHNQAFYEMFSHSLRKMDDIHDARKQRMHLSYMVQFHVTVKDWLVETIEVYSPFVLIQLICLTMYLACSVFQLDFLFQLFLANLNLTIFVFIIRVLFGTGTLATFCYFGKLSTDSFERMADCLYENNWYTWSIDSQKYIVIMMMNAQRAIYYHGFGVALLNLETFTRLLKAVVTYYMAFKTLEA